MKPAQHFSADPPLTLRRQLAFTMIEIALCLAIIGFALVAIIGVLPTGMQVQKDNREDTIINQDATYLIEAIRGGARGLDDLTNYVSAITNRVTVFNAAGAVVTPTTTFGYTYYNSTINGALAASQFPITNGARIIGLLSTPKYQYATNINNGNFINYISRSNYVTAYLRAISGSAVEKATNADARAFAFSYRMTPEIIPYTFYDPLTINYTDPTLKPPQLAVRVARSNFWQYAKNQQTNLYEMRLLFRWPLQPNGSVGNGRQVFRTTVSSSITNVAGNPFFFFEPRSYVRVP